MWILRALGVVYLISGGFCREFQLLHEWNLLTFAEPFNYPKNPKYVPEETILTGIEVGLDRIFLAHPRIFGTGHPITFGYIPRNAPKTPLIDAYPSWDWHAEATLGNVRNCSKFVSVTRARIDRCNRLWVLDTGVLDALTVYNVVCPPKIHIFDLNTDQVVRTINFPKDVLRPFSLFTSMVLDETTETCDNAFLYLGDPLSPSLTVYNAKTNAAWRLSHPNMFPEAEFGRFSLLGESFTLMDGPVGITLSPTNDKLYFQSFASNKIFSIPTAFLRSGPKGPGFPDADLPVKLEFIKSSQAAPLATDPFDGSIVVAPCNDTGLVAFPGTNNPSLLVRDVESLQFVLDIRAAPYDKELWFISSRLQKFFKKSMNRNDVNFRLMRITNDNFIPGLTPGFVPGTPLGFAPGVGLAAATPVGLAPGANVGFAPGAGVGLVPGANIGFAPGAAVGLAPGAGVGLAPGANVGLVPSANIGFAPGAAVGLAPVANVGLVQGTNVGFVQGTATGLAPGAAVGLTQGTTLGFTTGSTTGTTAANTLGFAPGAGPGFTPAFSQPLFKP